MRPDPIRIFLPPITSGRQLLISQPSSELASPEHPAMSKQDVERQSLWSTFWQDFCLENEPFERCYVPGDGRNTVDRHWTEFAAILPDAAQIIDLGSGAGVVGRTLIESRNDLTVSGVDWANVPKLDVPNLTIHSGVSMEALPFVDGQFDAAVSLFGIEYGNIDKTAFELKRVLKPGAHFSFLIHHRDSEILREGVARRRALKELIWGKMKVAFLARNAVGLARQRLAIARQFPEEPTVKLLSDYFMRNVERGREERKALWQKLADDFEPEVLLLTHLERAAKSGAEVSTWLAPLISTMSLVSVSVVRRNAGEPIAWNVHGLR